LGLEGEFLYFQGDYERLSDTEINVASVDISIRLRAFYTIWRLRPFVGGGVGFFDSDLYAREASSESFENVAGGQAAGWQTFAGVVLPAMKRWSIELGWRWIHLRQDFEIYSSGQVQLGGNMLYLGITGGY
jgi:opacity protein-like surface antigen